MGVGKSNSERTIMKPRKNMGVMRIALTVAALALYGDHAPAQEIVKMTPQQASAFAKLALKGAPTALKRSKHLFDDLYHQPVRDHIDYATNLHKDMRTSPEAVEGLQAFAEKRLPSWDPEG